MRYSIGIIVSTVIIVVLTFLYIGTPAGAFNNSLALVCLMGVAFTIVSFISYQRRSVLRRHWEKPSNLFLLALVIVYYQWIIDIVIGYKQANNILCSSWLNAAMIVAAIGILAFYVGYASHEVSTPKPVLRDITLRYSSDSYLLLVFLQYVFFFLFLRYVNVGTLISGSYYQDAPSWGDASIYFEYLFYAVSYAIIILRVLKGNDSKNLRQFLSGFPILSLIVMAMYLVLRFFSGDRGPVIDFTLAFFFSYIIKTKAKIRAWMLVLFVVAGSIVMSLVGMARSYDTSASFSDRFSEAASAFEQSGRFGDDSKTILNSTEELAGSFDSYMVMIRGIKEHDDLNYGLYQVFGAVNSIPFVAGVVTNTLKVPLERTSSSMYATYSYYGKGNVISGLGSNCIGDFYMDFGVIGVIVFMFIVGMFFRYIDAVVVLSNIKSLSLFSLVFGLVYASRSVYIPRSTFIGDMRYVTMIIIILWLNHLVARRNKPVR